MNVPRFGLGAFALVAALATSAPAQTASSTKFGELLKRVPVNSNALLLVDLDGLFDSPIGKRSNWREQAKAAATKGLGLAPQMRRVVAAANVDHRTFDPKWKIVMGEARGTTPSLDVIAKREGGFVENIRTLPAAWTPRGFYMFTFPNQIVGFVMPSDRAAVGDWINSVLITPRTFPSSYADRGVFRAEGGAPVVLTLDLLDAISAKHAEPWLASQESVKQAKMSPKLLAENLAGIKSAMIAVDADETLKGSLRLEFSQPATFQAPIVKELIEKFLDEYGAEFPDLARWRAVDTGKNQNALEWSGPMSEESVRRLVSLIAPPPLTSASGAVGGAEAEAARSDAPTQPKPSKPDVATTSQAYFHAVTDLLDGLKKQKGRTTQSTRLWYDRYAQQIEELPILNVDKDLLDWGNVVARTLREIAFGVNYASKNAAYAMASSPQGVYTGYDGYYYATSTGYNRDALLRQTHAVTDVAMSQKWELIDISIGDIRRKMTEKYQVEF